MKVILQQDVKGQGKKGQMIEVSEGYARNFLLPRKIAIAATADAIKTMNLKEKARKAEEARQKAEAEATAEKLKECMVKLTAKAGSGGRLFGAVTTKEISDGLKAQYGIDIPKQKLVLDEPIKSFGSYQVKAWASRCPARCTCRCLRRNKQAFLIKKGEDHERAMVSWLHCRKNRRYGTPVSGAAAGLSHLRRDTGPGRRHLGGSRLFHRVRRTGGSRWDAFGRWGRAVDQVVRPSQKGLGPAGCSPASQVVMGVDKIVKRR